jgi:Flp pilus assembly protein TadG
MDFLGFFKKVANLSSRSKGMKDMRKIRLFGNERGIAALLVAGILLTFLLLFFVVGIEFSRMYYVRGELQNAADAAAMAGAAKMITDKTNPDYLVQTDARNTAKEFALHNKAAGQAVTVADDGSNTLSSDNDLTVGYWDGTNYTPGGALVDGEMTVNAIQVRPQRATGLEPARGAVGFLFTGIGNLLGWNKMDIRRQAIAADPPTADAFFAICWDGSEGACIDDSGNFCSNSVPCSFSPPRFFVATNGDPKNEMAWSTLLFSPTSVGGNSGIDALLCGNQPSQEVCGKEINNTLGTSSSVFKNLESLMYDPLYDSSHKSCTDGSCDSSSDAVTGWTVWVPVTSVCPPGVEAHQADPKPVFGYAQLHLAAVCGSGAGLGTTCSPYKAPNSVCNSWINTYRNLYGSTENNLIVVDSISCVRCDDRDDMHGFRASLIR